MKDILTKVQLAVGICIVAFAAAIRSEEDNAPRKSPAVRKIEVQAGIRLEVLDWAGAGRALVFLHGAGCTAHIFEDFAPRFSPANRVIAITRRGAGASDRPSTGYSDERFARDIVAVVDALGLSKPVVVGHSMAGAEMSWLNTHCPERFSGYVYLDAASPGAFYSEYSNDPDYFPLAVLAMRQRLDRLIPGSGELHPKQVAAAMLRDLPDFQRQLSRWMDAMRDFPEPTIEDLRSAPPYLREWALGIQRYASLQGRILAIFPVPFGERTEQLRFSTPPEKRSLSQMDAFEYSVRHATIVRIPGATHFVFQSHPDEVARAMKSFVAELGQ